MLRSLCVLLFASGCATSSSPICAASTYTWTARASIGSLPADAVIGLVPDMPGWSGASNDDAPSIASGDYVATVDLVTGEVQDLLAGVMRSVGGARWFVPDGGALPTGALFASIGETVQDLVVEDGAAATAPVAVDAPTLISDDDALRAYVQLDGLPELPDGWYELAWATDSGEWSEAAVWSGAAATVRDASATADEVETCSVGVPLDRGSEFRVRVRAVSLNGVAGAWSESEVVTVR